MNSHKRQNHLEYYKEHGITPVHYDLSSLNAHLDRRESLYNMLGLLPLTFRDSNVLEVAAGTGHNSLYIAAQLPKSYVLLEPNPAALKQIQAAYSNFELPHTAPVVITEVLEDFNPDKSFDIVLCENWLGTSEHETLLMQKLAEFVAKKGVLVITVVSPIGFVPNLLRRFFVPYLASQELEFGLRTKIVADAFGPHLSSLPTMTRNVTDWVQDNMLNPAYFGLCLSAPRIIEQLGESFEVIRSYPAFEEDWRWFKGLHGEFRQRNKHFMEQYWQKCHNFLDCKAATFPSDAAKNRSLEKYGLEILSAVENHEDAHLAKGDIVSTANAICKVYEQFITHIPNELSEARSALEEIRPFLYDPASISSKVIGELKQFGALFGRETSYIALLKS